MFMGMCQNNDTSPFLLSCQIKEDIKNRTFRLQKINIKIRIFASDVAGGRKYCKNERLCNLLIISNKTFKGQK
jgi:hypothetical protein